MALRMLGKLSSIELQPNLLYLCSGNNICVHLFKLGLRNLGRLQAYNTHSLLNAEVSSSICFFSKYPFLPLPEYCSFFMLESHLFY